MRVEFEQGSDAWLQWRQGGLGGSDAATIMGLNPWKTKYQLWAEKTGRLEPEPMNANMERGVRCEPIARQKYIAEVGLGSKPACFIHDEFPFMRASLDGISMSGDTIFETKAPGVRAYDKIVSQCRVPAYNVPQLQWNMIVSGATRAHFYPYSEDYDTSMLLVMRQDTEMQDRLIEEAAAFWQLIQTDTPPEAEVDEHISVEYDAPVMEEYVEMSVLLNSTQRRLKELKPTVLDWGDGASFRAGRLKVTLTTPPKIDWRAYATELDPALSRVEEFTETTHRWTIRTTK